MVRSKIVLKTKLEGIKQDALKEHIFIRRRNRHKKNSTLDITVKITDATKYTKKAYHRSICLVKQENKKRQYS